MIPKVIHYCWFGRNPKSPLIERCIKSWHEKLPDFEIREWNEDNFDVSAHKYTKAAYSDKKWAFVSDYARLKILEEHGGIYLDTDMFVLRDMAPLLGDELFIGKEDDVYVNAAILGSVPAHPFLKSLIQKYELLVERVPIPIVATNLLKENTFNIKVYDKEYFYPFSSETIKNFDGSNAPAQSYAVHLWDYSWGNPVVKWAKKIGVYSIVKNLFGILGIKKVLKKVFNLE